jgi:hypothetical protein
MSVDTRGGLSDIIDPRLASQNSRTQTLEHDMTGRRVSLFCAFKRPPIRINSSRFSKRNWATWIAVMAVAAVVVIALLTIMDASKHFLAPQEHAGAMILGDSGKFFSAQTHIA